MFKLSQVVCRNGRFDNINRVQLPQYPACLYELAVENERHLENSVLKHT